MNSSNSSPSFNSNELLFSIREIPSTVICHYEKTILFILLSCMNSNNDTWYSMESISNFSCICLNTVRKYLRSLIKKQFIFVDKPGYYTHNTPNHYHLNINLIKSYHPHRVIPISKSPPPGDTDMAKKDTLFPKVGITPCTLSVSPGAPDRVHPMHPKKDIKKEIKKDSYGAANFSVDNFEKPEPRFEPNEENKKLALELKLDVEKYAEEFRQKYRNALTQENFRGWLEKSRNNIETNKYQEKKDVSPPAPRPQPPEWKSGHPTYDELHRIENKPTNREQSQESLTTTGDKLTTLSGDSKNNEPRNQFAINAIAEIRKKYFSNYPINKEK